MSDALDSEVLARAADAISRADALLFTGGAGMGVDSGMPDYRGDEGFWEAHPPYRRLGVSFDRLTNPKWFSDDPCLAWGFYGHRRNLYRRLSPHIGFAILHRWGMEKPGGYFVYTSNVDGHYQRAGFDNTRIVECHGAIEWEQCLAACGAGIYRAQPGNIEVDDSTMRVTGPLPSCPKCSAVSRPNVSMFEDSNWLGERAKAERARLDSWLSQQQEVHLTVVECGAGTTVPNVRNFGERVARSHGSLVRINLREAEVFEEHLGSTVGLPGRAKDVLQALENILVSRRG